MLDKPISVNVTRAESDENQIVVSGPLPAGQDIPGMTETQFIALCEAYAEGLTLQQAANYAKIDSKRVKAHIALNPSVNQELLYRRAQKILEAVKKVRAGKKGWTGAFKWLEKVVPKNWGPVIGDDLNGKTLSNLFEHAAAISASLPPGAEPPLDPSSEIQTGMCRKKIGQDRTS
jgi:hypothetical protein